MYDAKLVYITHNIYTHERITMKNDLKWILPDKRFRITRAAGSNPAGETASPQYYACYGFVSKPRC